MRQYKHYIIYKITNLINGKIYIGKHRCNDLDDGYFGSGKVLWLAINKYGLENFLFHLEIDLKNEKEMDLLEEMVVNKEFLARDDVYNLSRGGINPCMYGKKNPFYGKTHSREVCERVSKRFGGKHLTQEHKDRISRGFKRLLEEHPEIRVKFGNRRNKRKCRNSITGEIKFFNIDEIPENFDIYVCQKPVYHASEERKLELRKERSEYNRRSKWYNNGHQEKFCPPSEVPEGFVLGRLPTLNVGRKYSKETLLKMSKAKLGKAPSNKGKLWITNGIENHYVSKELPIPEGWWHGMTHKNKIRNINEAS